VVGSNRRSRLDIRAVLSSVRVPTLVLDRTGDVLPVEGARWLAGQIPGARFVELPGDDHWPWLSDPDEIVDEAEEFLSGERRGHQPDRAVLADRGNHSLKGAPGEWRLYAVAG
jgi:pimeloyl-ACP methyl ester carboxylesterase